MPQEQGHEGSILEGSDAEFDPRPTAVKRYSQLHRKDTGDESMATDNDDDGAFSGRYSKVSEDRQRLREPSVPVEREKQMEMADLGDSQVMRGSLRRRNTGKEEHLSSDEREAQQAREDAQQRSSDEGADVPSSSERPVRAIDHAEADNNDDAQDSATKEKAAERNREDYDVDAFAHPASKEPQRIIWLPEDELGLAVAEVQDNQSIGILSTTKDAVLDSKVRGFAIRSARTTC